MEQKPKPTNYFPGLQNSEVKYLLKEARVHHNLL